MTIHARSSKGKAARVHVSSLHEKEGREQSALLRYGEQCIAECRGKIEGVDYLERLSAIADLHVQGYRLGVDGLFGGDAYSRINLPTYPFARERYWVDEGGAAPANGARHSQLGDILDGLMEDEFDVARAAEHVELLLARQAS